MLRRQYLTFIKNIQNVSSARQFKSNTTANRAQFCWFYTFEYHKSQEEEDDEEQKMAGGLSLLLLLGVVNCMHTTISFCCCAAVIEYRITVLSHS